MARRHYLITYDVSDDKRRDRIFQLLLDNGDHAQYSVFFCELSPLELAQLRGELLANVHPREDQVLIVDLGDAHHPLDAGVECLGKGYQPQARVVVV